MKKILIGLLSFLCILTNPMVVKAEESAYDILMQGKGGTYSVGDVLELPFTTTDWENKANAKFIVIGKDEDYKNSLTLMSIENLNILDTCDCYSALDGTLSDVQDWLDNGTFDDNYEGDTEAVDLIGISGSGVTNGVFFTVKDNTTSAIDYSDSQIDSYASYFDTLNQGGLTNRIMSVTKTYTTSSSGTDSKACKYFLPSLKELGITSDLSKDEYTYSLFASKNIFEIMDQKNIDTSKDFNIYTRDLDVANTSLIAIDHNVNNYIVKEDYTTKAGRYALHGLGICFVVTYDEDVDSYKNATSSSVTLYANNASSYYVMLPKKVFIQSDAVTKFNILVKGDIAGDEKVKLTFDSSINLAGLNGNAGRTVPLTIAGSLNTFSYSHLKNDKTATDTLSITSPEISAGEWEVAFPITIALE